MKPYYLEVVTEELTENCESFSESLHVQFDGPIAELGNAFIAELDGGGFVGIRKPMSEAELPVVRPYWLVDDIEVAVAKMIEKGAELMHPPLLIEGYGTFAIVQLGGNQQGFWQC